MKVSIIHRSNPESYIDTLSPDARRYFKQSEIVLFRQAPENMPQLALDKPSVGGKDPVQTPLTSA